MISRRAITLMSVAVLLFTACGSDDGDDAAGTTAPLETSAAVTTPAAATTPPDTAAESTDAPSTDSSTPSESSGPADSATLVIDPADCPEDANTPLADGAPLKLGNTLALSGPAAANLVVEGFKAYMDKINAEKGGIDGHQIEMIIMDDQFDPGRSAANLTELIQSEKVTAMGVQQGSGNIKGTFQLSDESCMPRPLVPAGIPDFGDPAAHPFTNTGFMAYNTEARLWVDYITKVLPDGAKVGMVNFNSDQGKAYEKGFRAAIEGTNIEISEVKYHEGTAVNVDNEVTAVVASGPDVVIGGSGGTYCGKILAALGQAGYAGQVIMSQTCAGVETVFKTVGDAADGAVVLTSFKDPADPRVAEDADVKAYIADITKYAPSVNPKQLFVSIGYRHAAAFADILERAAAMDGGLTRVNIMNAAWSMDFTPPFALDGVKFAVNGITDAYPLESGEMWQYDAAGGTLVATGIAVSAEGQTGLFGG